MNEFGESTTEFPDPFNGEVDHLQEQDGEAADWELDVDFYRSVYPDLAHLTAWRAKFHWRRVGKRENRVPSLDAAMATAFRVGAVDFDPAVYLLLNEDLVAGGIDTEARAVVHFISVGHEERRPYQLTGRAGLVGSAGPAFVQPPTKVERSLWPTAEPHHLRPVAWNDPADLASRILGRSVHDDRSAVEGWLVPLDSFSRAVALLTCDEKESAERAFASIPSEDFALFIFVMTLGRAPLPAELDAMVTALDYGDVRREQLLLQKAALGIETWRRDRSLESDLQSRSRTSEILSAAGAIADSTPELQLVADGATTSDLSFLLLGTGRMVTRADWDNRLTEVASEEFEAPRAIRRQELPLGWDSATGPLVTVISSIYKPGSFLRPFFEQIVNQTIFAVSEVVCLLVEPSEGELELAREYADRHPNVVLVVEDTRIGIYDAWNRAIEQSTGLFITNANVDDLRRRDSLEVQARTLLRHDWVDVVYQDVLYTLDSTLSWEEIEEIGFRTKLPPVSAWSLLGMNSPHNAPMWRRDLHDELGLFDDTFQSAGDYEFWLRCVAADKVFFKVRDAHVAYYVNPRGLSTRPGGAGLAEAKAIGLRYVHLLDYPNPPPNTPAPSVLGPQHHARAERLTLALCDQLIMLRSLQGV